jgi:hypothetical protein
MTHDEFIEQVSQMHHPLDEYPAEIEFREKMRPIYAGFALEKFLQPSPLLDRMRRFK